MSAVVGTRSGARLGRLAGAGLLAAVGTAVVTTAAAALLHLGGVDFEVDGGEVPVAGIGTVTFVASSVGVLLAVALRWWSARPAEHFVRVAFVLTALSLVPPVLWGRGAGTVVALEALHLLAAVVMIGAMARLLRPETR
ncbi:DUF6069 family protein [Nocardioides zeicaulis]|uniref:DUF6069 family protein n=1 Tax=Nocardioides zeicaulis TaxID=1776857 RepID=A0ABV6E0D7_9ACTN